MNQTNFILGQVVEEVAEYLRDRAVHYDDVTASIVIFDAAKDLSKNYFQRACDVLVFEQERESPDQQARIAFWLDVLRAEDQTPLF